MEEVWRLGVNRWKSRAFAARFVGTFRKNSLVWQQPLDQTMNQFEITKNYRIMTSMVEISRLGIDQKVCAYVGHCSEGEDAGLGYSRILHRM